MLNKILVIIVEYHFTASIHHSLLIPSDESVVRRGPRLASKPATANSLYVFSVECLKIGETELTLEVGNERSARLKNPVVVSSKVKVVCGQPEQIVIKADVRQPEGNSQPCPLNAR